MASELTNREITIGWIIYIVTILFMLTLGILFDMWYSKKQNAIFENPPDYLIGETDFN